jgi:anti-sigma factor RsiW
MCDLSQELIAWLDGELRPQDARTLEQHVQVCSACQSELRTFRQLDATIDAYCDAAILSKAPALPNTSAWRPVLAGTLASAAAVLIFFLAKPGVKPPQISATPNGVPAIAFEKTPSPPAILERVPVRLPVNRAAGETTAILGRHRHRPQASDPVNSASVRHENWVSHQGPIYIAIPADALFPPGAFPEGVGFVADVNWRPDGSAQQLRLQTQLVPYQRREAQP